MAAGTFVTQDYQTLLDYHSVSAAVGFRPKRILFVDSVNGGTVANGFTGESSIGFPSVAGGNKGPLSTLAAAIGLCSGNGGEVIYVADGHAETLATTTQGIALNKAGVTIIGGGNARNRPAFTCGAADVPGVVLSVANCRLKNLRFIGSTSQTTASSVILSITGTDNTIEDCVFEHGGAGPLQACRMTTATRTVWKNCTWLGTAAGPDVAIAVMATSRNCRFEDLLFNYAGSSGLDTAAIWTSTTVDCGGSLYKNLFGISMDLTMLDLNSSQGAKGDSLLYGGALVSNAAITLANSMDLGGCVAANCWLSDNYLTAPVQMGAIGAITTASQRIPSGSPCT